MLGASLVANMRLIGILDMLHRFAASRARAICNVVIGFAGFCITGVEKLRHPFVFKLLGFA